MASSKFEILTYLNKIKDRPDFKMADPTLLDPRTANSLAIGEWLSFDSSGFAIRTPTKTTRIAYQSWSPQGDFPNQALGAVTMLRDMDYEAKTDLFEAGSYANGTELTVGLVSMSGITRSVLTAAVSGNVVHAIASGPVASGMLTYHRVPPYTKA